MKERSIVVGSFAALAVSSAALGDFIFYTDPDEFYAAIEAQGKVSKGFWDFKPHNVGSGFVGEFDDPLNFMNIPQLPDGTPYWDSMPLDNIQFQSNLNPQGEGGPNPRGVNGLQLFTPPDEWDNNVLLARNPPDTFDILSGVPVDANHTAMALEIIGTNNLVHVTVWDKNEEHMTKLELFPFPPGKQFVGILAEDARTIGRVNIDAHGGFEGISSIEVFVIPAPGSLALLGLSCFVGRRRRRS